MTLECIASVTGTNVYVLLAFRISQDAPPPPPEVLAVVGSSGEVCPLARPLPAPPAPGAVRLETWLPQLEQELRSSLIANTRHCVAACGQMPAEQWVASFPSQAVMLVDAVVWTQSVTHTLGRVAGGDRSALRNLLDQSVLRLETMARQLRAAMVSVPLGLLYGGRQVQDLGAKAAAAALTAAGTAAVVASGATEGTDEPPPVMAAAVTASSGASSTAAGPPPSPSLLSAGAKPPPPVPQPAPPFVVAATTSAAALAAAAAAVAAAATTSGTASASNTPRSTDGGAAGPVSTPYQRARRSAIIFEPAATAAASLNTQDGSAATASGGPAPAPGPTAAAAAVNPAAGIHGNPLLTRQAVRSMERLLAAGVCHR